MSSSPGFEGVPTLDRRGGGRWSCRGVHRHIAAAASVRRTRALIVTVHRADQYPCTFRRRPALADDEDIVRTGRWGHRHYGARFRGCPHPRGPRRMAFGVQRRTSSRSSGRKRTTCKSPDRHGAPGRPMPLHASPPSLALFVTARTRGRTALSAASLTTRMSSRPGDRNVTLPRIAARCVLCRPMHLHASSLSRARRR